MKIKPLNDTLTVCKIRTVKDADLTGGFYFLARTDEELSLVCPTERVPPDTLERDDGWNAFRLEGVLDFSMTGVLAKLSGLLAQNGVPIFAVSTFNTDYVLVKKERFQTALGILSGAGYEIL